MDRDRSTPLLHYACQRHQGCTDPNNLITVQRLLRRPNIQVNVCDDTLWTPLHHAVTYDLVAVTR
jgi:ankyrin repeat protein